MWLTTSGDGQNPGPATTPKKKRDDRCGPVRLLLYRTVLKQDRLSDCEEHNLPRKRCLIRHDLGNVSQRSRQLVRSDRQLKHGVHEAFLTVFVDLGVAQWRTQWDLTSLPGPAISVLPSTLVLVTSFPGSDLAGCWEDRTSITSLF
jgi:hypothetical protein